MTEVQRKYLEWVGFNDYEIQEVETEIKNGEEIFTFEGYQFYAWEGGYNKANEWHKDLPTKDVRLAIIEVEDCGYLFCEYREGVWYDKGSSAVCKDWITQNIKRWKEIVLPEIKECE